MSRERRLACVGLTRAMELPGPLGDPHHVGRASSTRLPLPGKSRRIISGSAPAGFSACLRLGMGARMALAVAPAGGSYSGGYSGGFSFMLSGGYSRGTPAAMARVVTAPVTHAALQEPLT